MHLLSCPGTLHRAGPAVRSRRVAAAAQRPVHLPAGNAYALAAAVAVVVSLSSAICPHAVGPALAVLNSPNAQIARSPDAALRRATPAFNPDVLAVQRKLEDVQTLLRIPQRKPWGGMAKDVREAQVLSPRHCHDTLRKYISPSLFLPSEWLTQSGWHAVGRERTREELPFH